MPSTFSALDTSFPNLEGKNTQESLQTIMDYLYQLLEQLRYTLHNLGTQNFNQTELNTFVNEITEPIHISLQEEIDRATGAEGQLSTEIDIQAGRITSEITRATAEEGVLSSRITQTAEAISTEVTRATTEEGVLRSSITQTAEAITAEVTRATTEEGTLSSRITQTAEAINSEVTRATGAEGTLSSRITQTAADITSEVTRATAAEGVLQSSITQNADAITAEVTRATTEEGALSSRITQTASDITSEVTRASAAEGALSTRITQNADAISAEVTRATGAEGTLSTRVTQNATAISSEATRASNAEGALSSSITQTAAEVSTKVSKNSVISEINQSAESIVISAGKVDLSGKVSFSDLSTAGRTTISGSNITTGEIHAIDIYGSEFMDAGGNAGLDVTSSQYHQRLRFGVANQAYEYGAFGIDSYDNGNTQYTTMRFFGTDILRKSGYGTSYVEATGEWDFSGPLVLNAGYNYGSLAQRNAISSPRTGQLFFVI